MIHTRSPLPGASADAALVELCIGLGESLVSNAPGRALSASIEGKSINVLVYPSKPEGVFVPQGWEEESGQFEGASRQVELQSSDLIRTGRTWKASRALVSTTL